MSWLDPLLSGIGYVGDSLDKIGSRQLRGALGGHYDELASVVPFSDRIGLTNPSRIVSGRDLNKQWGLSDDNDPYGGLKAFVTESLLDPKNLVGTGFLARKPITDGAQAAIKAVAPAAKSIGVLGGKIAKGESGALNWGRLASYLISGDDAARANTGRLLKQLGPEKYAENIVGTTADHLPAVRAAALANHVGTPIDFATLRPGSDGLAAYFSPGTKLAPSRLGVRPHVVGLNMDRPDIWLDPSAMGNLVSDMYGRGHWSTPHPDHVAIHELVHSLHIPSLDESAMRAMELEGLDSSVASKIKGVSQYAAMSPFEAVAEAGARQATGGTLRPYMQHLYAALHGPDVSRLAEAVKANPVSSFLKDESGALKLAEPQSRFRSLMKARREITGLKDVEFAYPESGQKWISAGRFVGGPNSANRIVKQVRGMSGANAMTLEQLEALKYAGDANQKGIGGLYHPVPNAVYIRKGADKETLRHELMHGLIVGDTNPSIGPLGLLARKAFTIGDVNGPINQSAAWLGEVAAHAAERRGAMNQLRSARDFLMDANRQKFYSDWYTDQGMPVAAKLSRVVPAVMRGIPPAAIGVAGGAGLGGAAMLRDYLQK